MDTNWPIYIGFLLGAVMVFIINSVIDLIEARSRNVADLEKLDRQVEKLTRDNALLNDRVHLLSSRVASLEDRAK